MDIIIATRSRRFAIERNLYIQSGICGKIYLHIIPGWRDLVIDVRRTGIVPLLENIPGFTSIRSNQDDELIILLQRIILDRISIVEIRESHAKREQSGIICRQRDARTDDPVLAGSSIKIHVSMIAIKHSVPCTELPGSSGSKRRRSSRVKESCSLEPIALRAQRLCIRQADKGFERSRRFIATFGTFTNALHAHRIGGVRREVGQGVRSQVGVLDCKRPIRISGSFVLYGVGFATTRENHRRAVRRDVSNVAGLRFGASRSAAAGSVLKGNFRGECLYRTARTTTTATTRSHTIPRERTGWRVVTRCSQVNLD